VFDSPNTKITKILKIIDLRKLLVTLYVKCIIYYTSKSGKLVHWLSDSTILGKLAPIMENDQFVDVDESCFSLKFTIFIHFDIKISKRYKIYIDMMTIFRQTQPRVPLPAISTEVVFHGSHFCQSMAPGSGFAWENVISKR